MNYFFTGIGILILSSIASLFVSEKNKLRLVSLFGSIAMFFLVLPALAVLFTGESLSFSYNWNLVFNSVPFVIDRLSAFFIVVISLITTLAYVYSMGYMLPYSDKSKKFASHCFMLPVLSAAMLLVVTVQNALFFLIVWEIMSLASFFLVIFEDDKKEVLKSGIKYLIYMHISVIFIIALFALLSIKSGSYDFENYKNILIDNPSLKNIVFLFAFLGFGTKAGFVPMHNWLPDAHPSAPSHVSAVMSAVMIKTGIYGILRVIQFIDKPTEFIAYLMLIISVVTALYGIIYAINQKDIKKLLAYSSVENIGLIGLAMSIMLIGLLYDIRLITIVGAFACLLHILNHAVFKSLLFMGAGCIYLQTHTKDMEQLGGLIKMMPKTAICFLFGAVAICAFPPLNGFVSEFLMYAGLFNILKISNSTLFILSIFAISALALVGTLVILAMTKVYSITFLGLPRTQHAKKVDSDVSKAMIMPMGILSAFTLLIGLLSPMFSLMVPAGVFTKENLMGIYPDLFIVSLFAFVLFITIFIFALFLITKNKRNYETWGCGYDKGNNHIQYTASSFVSPFTSILTPLFKKIFDVKKPKGFFPTDAHYESSVEDVEEAYIINPILKFDEKFLSKFERLQDGNIQHYILYGLIFLILMLIGVVFVG